MIRLLILVILVATTGCRIFPISTAYPLDKVSDRQTIMTSTANVIVKNVTLKAREENAPPKGVSPPANRDIGFASVFLNLENTQETNVTVLLKKIEIRNASNDQLQSFTYPTQEIHLKPLEYSQLVFHLTNKTGYSGQDWVKAILTYQIGDRVTVIESEPVEIEKH